MIELRPYQKDCLKVIAAHPTGRHMVRLATGLGKTVIFSHIPSQGKVLILSHREELVRQPLKYYDCSTAIEMAGAHAHDSNAEVVSASVQTLTRRLPRYAVSAFDTIIVDEAHHAAATSYRRILEHFKPRLVLGFTATPNRGDNVRLDDVFEDIIFDRDLEWGIRNGYLCDIYCRRVHIGFDLSTVRTRNGDYAPDELAEAMDGTADAVAQAARDLATGATLIFAASVRQCHEIAKRIPGAVAVTGETKNRAELIQQFTDRKIPCLVNCMVFTEGTDMPLIESIIIARPTKSESLYAQMVGRGLRLHPDKARLNLIDCVGVSNNCGLCTAPSLFGIDMDELSNEVKSVADGDLLEMRDILLNTSRDTPSSWIRNVEIVNIWSKRQNIDTHGVNYFKMPDGSFLLSLPDRKIFIPAMDELGRTRLPNGKPIHMQEAMDRMHAWLMRNEKETRQLWDLTRARKWGKDPATEKQKAFLKNRVDGIDIDALTKLEAAMVTSRIMANWRNGNHDRSTGTINRL